MLKSSHWNANLQLSSIKVILCRRSADRLDHLLLAIKPVVENRHSTGTDAAEVDISASRIFSADVRLTKIRRLSRISTAAGGSNWVLSDSSELFNESSSFTVTEYTLWNTLHNHVIVLTLLHFNFQQTAVGLHRPSWMMRVAMTTEMGWEVEKVNHESRHD